MNQAELEAKPDKNVEIINTLEETPKQETELPTIETISPKPHLAKTDDIPKIAENQKATSPIKREPIPIERESPIEAEVKPTTDEFRLIEESKQPVTLKLNVIPAVEKIPRRKYKHQQKTDKIMIVTNDHTAAAASIAPIAVIEQLPQNELVVVEAKLKEETTLFSDVVKNETSEKKKPVEVVVAEKREIIDKKDEKISSKHNNSQQKPTTSSITKTVKPVETKIVETKEEVVVTKQQQEKSSNLFFKYLF